MSLNAERRSHYENKKEQIIFTALSEKIRHTRDLVETLTACPRETFLATLDEKVQSILDAASPKTRNALDTLKALNTEMERINNEREGVTNRRKLDELYMQVGTLWKEDTNNALLFLEYVDRLQANLRKKFNQATQFGDGEELRRKTIDFLEEREEGFPRDAVLGVERDTAFTIRATVSADAMKTYFDDGRGTYFAGSPVFVVNDGPQRDIVTERHERLHAITEGLLASGYPSRHVMRSLGLVEQFFPKMGDIAIESFGSQVTGKGIVNGLHGELVAALEHAMETDFDAKMPTTESGRLLHFLGIKDRSSDRLLNAFSTASLETNKVLKAISDFKTQHTYNPALLHWVTDLEQAFRKEFVAMAEGIERAHDVIMRHSNDQNELANARIELLALACFLKPTQYRHADRYMLKWYYKHIE